MSINPQAALLIEQINALNLPKVHELLPEQAREAFQAVLAFDAPPPELKRIEDLDADGIPVRLYQPEDTKKDCALVFIHGGGWVIGDIDSHHNLAADIAKQMGMTVISIDYRLAPEHPFPAALEDCLKVVRWLLKSPEEIGHHVGDLVISGDSAGGNLSAVIAQTLPEDIAAQFLIYPAIDIHGNYPSTQENAEGYLLEKDSMTWFYNHYVQDRTLSNDKRLSPLRADSLANLPPAVILTCTKDPLHDEGVTYHEELIKAGTPSIHIEGEGHIHGCMNLRAAIPDAQVLLTQSLNTLKKLLRNK